MTKLKWRHHDTWHEVYDSGYLWIELTKGDKSNSWRLKFSVLGRVEGTVDLRSTSLEKAKQRSIAIVRNKSKRFFADMTVLSYRLELLGA